MTNRPARIREAITRRLRVIASSRNPAITTAKRAVTSILIRTNVVVAARLNDGGLLYVDLANAVGRSIWLRGDYSAEGPIGVLIASTLRNGDVFLDVGANVGFFSLLASRTVGSKGQVHAFEPLPRLAALLRRTVAANRLTNMWIIEAAVRERDGRISMAAMPDSAYSHVIEGANAIDGTHGGWRPVVVNAIALDDYVEQVIGRMPRLIKMDIEGSELEALAGASRMLADAAGPDLICEVGSPHLARFGHSPEELFEVLRAAGYVSLHPATLAPMKPADLSQNEYNVLFKKRSR